MGFYRIIKMIFRDILFKIPKKYLVVVIVLLTMFILKNNVFAYNMDTGPQRGYTEKLSQVPYEDIETFYQYFPLFTNTFSNNSMYGETYSLDTDYRFFTDNNSRIFFSGEFTIPRYSNYYNNHAIIGCRSTYVDNVWDTPNWRNWGWDLYCKTNSLKSNYYLNNSVLDFPVNYRSAQQTTQSFQIVAVSSGDISGYVNGAQKSVIVSNQSDNTYTDDLHDIDYLSFNVGSSQPRTIAFISYFNYK